MTTTTFDLASLPDHLAGSGFDHLRGLAINAYASLEQSLSRALACFGEMPPDVAGLIFFRMVNTRSRMSVLEKLMRRRYGVTYGPFWNSFVRHIESLDKERNKIVHWHRASIVNSGPQPTFFLVSPNIYELNVGSEQIGVPDMVAFTIKADFFTRLLNMFILLLNRP